MKNILEKNLILVVIIVHVKSINLYLQDHSNVECIGLLEERISMYIHGDHHASIIYFTEIGVNIVLNSITLTIH